MAADNFCWVPWRVPVSWIQEVVTMSCPKCAKHRLIDITVTIADARVTMHSCSNCSERWWDRDGERVALPDVLHLASSNR